MKSETVTVPGTHEFVSCNLGIVVCLATIMSAYMEVFLNVLNKISPRILHYLERGTLLSLSVCATLYGVCEEDWMSLILAVTMLTFIH